MNLNLANMVVCFPSEPDDERILVNKQVDCDRLGIQNVPLFVAAPMVRYSKLPFRRLVALYNCDIAYTPMIYADCFVNSEKARQVEYVSVEGDWPIVQFAAKRPGDFADAAELVYRHCRGIDLNCGCPKSDVRSKGCGSKLLEEPEQIADIVRGCRARISDPEFSISVKIRIQYPIERTVDLCRKLEHTGISHIAVHARTVSQRNEPPDYGSVATIKQALHIPVYANGNCKSYAEALEIARITGADGVMAANGLLENPALFAGHPKTPQQCITDWLGFVRRDGEAIPFDTLHQQLMFMLRASLPKKERIELSQLRTDESVKEFLRKTYLHQHD